MKVEAMIERYIPKTVLIFGIHVLEALILLLIGKIVIRFIIRFFDRVFERAGTEVSVSKFLHSLIRVLCYIVLISIICAKIGIETTSFIAVLGSAGLAIGLALQGSLSNFAGGVLILMLHPFRVGDYIIEGSGGTEGTVSKIDLFYTTLITVDNRMVVIPNGILANNHLTNVTAFSQRYLIMKVGIAYDSDIAKAKKLIEQLLHAQERVMQEKEMLVCVSSLDSSQVTLELRAWVKTEDYWKTKWELNEQIKEAFDANQIQIPFEQLQVHIGQESKEATGK